MDILFLYICYDCINKTSFMIEKYIRPIQNSFCIGKVTNSGEIIVLSGSSTPFESEVIHFLSSWETKKRESGNILEIGTPHAVAGLLIGGTVYACYSPHAGTIEKLAIAGVVGLIDSVLQKTEIGEQEKNDLKMYATGIFRNERNAYSLMVTSIALMQKVLD